MREETAESTKDSQTGTPPRRPGVIVVFSGLSSVHIPLALERGGLVLGRGGGSGSILPDDRLSRRHAEVRFVPGEGWTVRDFDSRNGTYVDGARLQGVVRGVTPRVIRVAETLLVPCDDV